MSLTIVTMPTTELAAEPTLTPIADEPQTGTFQTFQKAYKFRAYPSAEQEAMMLSLLETHRRLYNAALSERKAVYEAEGRTVTYPEQSAHLKTARKANPLLARANFSSCQRTLKRLDRAFAAFFRRVKSRVKSGDKPGFPRFRGIGRFDSVEFTHGDGAHLTAEGRGGRVYFQSVGEVKVKCHRAVEGKIKTVTFRRQAGRWFVILTCEITCDVEQDEQEPYSLPAVGIDLGLKSFLVTSRGEAVETPRLYRKAQAKLRRSQRAVSRKKRGGSNRRKAVRSLARLHQKVADARRDFHHKTALDLVRRFGRIAHEDLNIQGIARSGLRGLAKSTHDAGWSQFLGILSHKAAWAGVELVAVDPRHTSQACSACGSLPPMPIGLSVRVYSCVNCGFICDRDENAAQNILKRSLQSRAGAPPLGANAVGCDKRCPRSPRL